MPSAHLVVGLVPDKAAAGRRVSYVHTCKNKHVCMYLFMHLFIGGWSRIYIYIYVKNIRI